MYAATLPPFRPAPAAVDDPEAIRAILGRVRERTGVDFSRYRAATVRRRIANRMISAGMKTLGEYLALVERSDDEPRRLLERLTIKVSRFYRNAPSFEVLRRELPALARRGEPIRAWSAGCGRGEEAYTLAMLLDEAGAQGTVEATDVDPQAIAAAAEASYPWEAVAELPTELARRYLEPFTATRRGQRCRVRAELRDRVRTSLHDLTSGAPPPGGPFALVACRNVLIYLGAEAQQAALRCVRGALAQGGLLLLGEAEWPSGPAAAAFAPIHHKAHLFRAVAGERADPR